MLTSNQRETIYNCNYSVLILLLHEILKGFQHLKIGKSVTVICTSDAGFIALKAPENVWRPGSARTRWGSLSAPPDPLAAKGGEGSKEGRGRAPTYFAVIRPLGKTV